MRSDPSVPYEAPHRVLPAWLFSLIFHVIVLTLVGWTAQRTAKGTASMSDRPIGIAVVERLPNRARYSPPVPTAVAADSSLSEQSASSASKINASSLAPANLSTLIDLDGAIAEMTSGDVPSIQQGDLDGAMGSGVDPSMNRSNLNLPGTPTTAMMFGVSGSGSRFIYVFDRSDSMNGYGGKPLRAAKQELKRSLQSLSEAQQFQVIFYNETAKPFVPAGSPVQLLTGSEAMIRRALSYIDVVKAFGGTEHFDALRLALRMGPDVVFFLTDARVPRLTQTQFDEIKRLADRSGAAIHAIEFGPESSSTQDSFLRKLASDNRGEYRYVSLSQLTASIPNASDTAAPTPSEPSTP